MPTPCVTVFNPHREAPMHATLYRAASCLLALLLSSHAQAAAAPALCDQLPIGQPLDSALAILHQLEPHCSKHPPYLYALGQLLNQAGKYDEAIDPLESALMYRPDHWPSQLEYAIALEGVGDRASALGLLSALAQNPAVDAATQAQLAALQRRQPPAVASERRGRINIATGHDNNLLSNTYHTQFTITTPNGDLPVQLADNLRPRAGSFVRAEVSYDGLLASTASAQWSYGLTGSFRTTPNFSAADVAQLVAQVQRTAAGEQGVYVLGQHQTLQRASTTSVRQTQLGLGYDFSAGPAGNCSHRLGLDLQHLSYPGNPSLNGHYTGLAGATTCNALGILVQVRAGTDRPLDSTRAGGAQRQTSLRIGKRTPIGANRLALEWETSRQQDEAGYSLLLGNNARRSIHREIYRLEYLWQLGGWSPYAGVEWVNQRSTLNLFEFRNAVATLGVRARW